MENVYNFDICVFSFVVAEKSLQIGVTIDVAEVE
jgi:hypothetical protein